LYLEPVFGPLIDDRWFHRLVRENDQVLTRRTDISYYSERI
jgi:hypothetical protein